MNKPPVSFDQIENPEVRELLETRGEDYGEAWKLASEVFRVIMGLRGAETKQVRHSDLLNSLYFHNWFQILGKLIRLSFTPHQMDSWMDIIGYATLVVEDLKKERERVSSTVRPD